MKHYFYSLLAFTLGVCLLSCSEKSSDSTPGAIPEKPAASVNSVANLTIENGMTLAQMNAVIAAANSGDIVWVEAGTYQITGKIVMKPGVILKRKTSTRPVFDATATGAELKSLYYTTDLNNCTFYGIEFRNLRLHITDASGFTFNNCVFDYGKRKAGTTKSYLSDAYLQLVSTTNALVTHCTFSRRSGNSGRGIYTVSSTNCQILNNTFGNGGSTGYFVTAINDNSNGTLIKDNVISRATALTNPDETDHGIYAHSFDGLTIRQNTISGWPANDTGGAVKARNGQNLLITQNTFNNSGILLYVYSTSSGSFMYLNNAVISTNTINVAGPANDLYHGIGYWRNTPDGTESSIRIEGNTIANGTIKADFASLNTAGFNYNGGGVFNNNISSIYLKAGINNSGNY